MSKELHSDICDEHLFSKVYEQHSTDVHNFLYYKYGEQFNPADKTQEAFIKLWENCAKVTLKTAKSFVFTIANNLTLNEIKHQKVVLKHQKTTPKEYTHESPEYLMEHQQYLERYQQALANLTEDQRVAFTLSKIEGKKHSEIAELLGVTKKVVEYRIYSAFDKLKEELTSFKI